MKMLEDLYYGNIHPFEKPFDPGSEYARLAKGVTDAEEKLTAFLKELPGGEEQARLLAQRIHAQSEITGFSELEQFIEGFRLGAGLMLEAFALPGKAG